MRSRHFTRSTSIAIVVSSVLGLIPATAVAQDPEASPAIEAMTDAPRVAEPAADPQADDVWLLRSGGATFELPDGTVTVPSAAPIDGPGAVIQLDGETGEVLSVLDAAVDGCTWTDLVGPRDGVVWLIAYDPSPTTAGAGSCVGRFPLDGSQPTLLAFEPGSSERFGGYMGKPDQAAVVDGDLYFQAYTEIKPDGQAQLGLFRFDPEAGTVDVVLPEIFGLARSGDQLFIMGPRGLMVVEPGSLEPRSLGIGKKQGLSAPQNLLLAASDEVVAITDAYGKGVAVDPATGTVLGDLGARDLFDPTVVGQDVWAQVFKKGEPTAGVVVPGGKAKFRTDTCEWCHAGTVQVTPDAVWTTFDGILRRIDRATREVTLELDLADVATQVPS